jgi:hypothetical protein
MGEIEATTPETDLSKQLREIGFATKTQDLWSSFDDVEFANKLNWSDLDRKSQALTKTAAAGLSQLLELRKEVHSKAKVRNQLAGERIDQESQAKLGRIDTTLAAGFGLNGVGQALISYYESEIKVLRSEIDDENRKIGSNPARTDNGRVSQLESELGRAIELRDFALSATSPTGEIEVPVNFPSKLN